MGQAQDDPALRLIRELDVRRRAELARWLGVGPVSARVSEELQERLALSLRLKALAAGETMN